jgi:hypothetical protein
MWLVIYHVLYVYLFLLYMSNERRIQELYA